MNIDEAYKILKDHGQWFNTKQLKQCGDYYSALGFLNGIIQGLLLYAPEEVRRQVLKK